MNEYRHHVTGFFAQPVDAEYVLAQLVMLGLPRERLYLSNTDPAPRASAPQAGDNAVLTNVLVDGAISSGQVVLVAETRTEQETESARQVMQAAVGACEDVSTV